MIHLVIDVFVELNKLTEIFSNDLVIVQQLGPLWIRQFLFWKDISYVVTDLSLDDWPRTWVHFCLQLGWMDGVLRWRNINNVEGTYHPMYHGWSFDWKDTLEESKMMGAMYLQAVVDSLIKRILGWLVEKKSMGGGMSFRPLVRPHHSSTSL
jgi:hypothetical protein